MLSLCFVVSRFPGATAQIARGRLDKWDIREASGLAASRKHSGVLYTHNDSGDRNRIFAINEWGKYLGTYDLSGAQARDWEDMAIGPGPIAGEDYLYVGDIGDNRAYYSTKIIYRVLEPNATRDPSKPESKILTGVERFEFRFPSHAGNANSETLMVDPHTGDLFIVRKTKDHPLQVFWARAPFGAPEGGVIELQEYHATCIDYNHECRDQHYNSPSKGQLVGGDISPSGLGLLIKSYKAVYYWRRSSLEESFFDSDPRILPYKAESQGEAICWDANEKGYFTLSEGRNPMLYYYPYQGHLKWLETVKKWEKGYSLRKKRPAEPSVQTKDEVSEMVSKASKAVTPKRFSWDSLSQVKGRLINDHIVVDNNCLDIPSPSGASCAAEATAGNCNLAWMAANGFCTKSCGRCKRRLISSSTKEEEEDKTFPGAFTSPPPKVSEPPSEESSIPVDSWWEQWMSSSSTTSSAARKAPLWSSPPRTRCSGENGGSSGRYIGPIVMLKKVPSSAECCSLCDQVNLKGNKRCDTWSFCKDGLGCGKFQYGTCLIKRSVTYQFRESQKWDSGYYSREDGSVGQRNLVLGVQRGPEEESMNWPLFFEDHANKSWEESMYMSDMIVDTTTTPTTGDSDDVSPIEASDDEGDWLCQKDLGVLTCPEKKCHALRGHYKGLIVAEIEFSSVARCCDACTNARKYKIPPHGMGCDVFSFCTQKEGCGLMQPYGSCLLKVVSEDPQLGLAWSYDPLKPFTSGRITET